MEFYDGLAKLFEGEDGDLFKAKEKRKIVTADDRLLESFTQITEFVRKNNRMPDKDADNLKEALLGTRLASIKSDKDKADKLEEYDELGLLDLEKAPESLDELFAKDGDIFSTEDGLFDVSVLPKNGQMDKNSGDIAKRKPVKDFAGYKQLFAERQAGLKAGECKLIRFRTVEELVLNGFYVVDNMMCYVDQVGKKKEVFGRQKERIRVIFENGTESNMYLRTLSSELYRSGYIVSDTKEEVVEDTSEIKGYIYILRSLSKDAAISTIKDFYKIGFTTTTVEDRIKNAENELTYLKAPVEVVATYRVTGDLNPQKVEDLIHRFFTGAKVVMEIIDDNGYPYIPEEWYSVPIEAVEEAVDLINSGEIVGYIYSNGRIKELDNE